MDTISPADRRHMDRLADIAGEAVLAALWAYSPELDLLAVDAQCAAERAVRAVLYGGAGIEAPA